MTRASTLLTDYLYARQQVPRTHSTEDYAAAMDKLARVYKKRAQDAYLFSTNYIHYDVNSSGGLSIRIPSQLNNQDLPIDFTQLLGECEIVKVVIQYRHADGKEYVITQYNVEIK